ncbi:MAG: hypothetical protein K1X67_19265 [Fimbriimonadaceae bacterium]|nr:hypothetical protein [Fimbriimonadaceae bacterium]
MSVVMALSSCLGRLHNQVVVDSSGVGLVTMLSAVQTYTGTQAQTIEYDYHHDGSRSDMSATVGGTNYAWHYNYDGRGLCNQMTSPAGTVNYSYQDNGALASREILNTSSSVISHTSYTYNEVGMLETLTNKESSSGATRSSYDLSASNSYDGVFNMKACVASITGLQSLSGTLGWTVDSKDRLTDEAVTSGSRSSGSVTGTNAYDLAANLTTLRGTSGITHNSNNQITPSTGQWAYDGMGNPTKFRGRDGLLARNYGCRVNAGFTILG